MPMTEPDASLSFLSWVRQGAASLIQAPETRGKQSAVVEIDAVLTVNDSPPLPPLPVRLRGPADVVGIDANQVVRTDPRPGSNDFEPDCFACIEFDRADFPWLFTPARADDSSRLRPWLCLVVVRKQEGVKLSSTVDASLPKLQLAAPAKLGEELPNLEDCWAWAHAQAAVVDAAGVAGALNGAPALSLSRLVCPRRLTADTDYLACVVPTFDLGRRTGLGETIVEAKLTAPQALTPAWTFAPPSNLPLELPVYYHWEFRTGPEGNFRLLALRLKPGAESGLGRRPIDISRPGFPVGTEVSGSLDLEVELEGALLPIVTGETTALPDPAPLPFQTALAPIINEAIRSEVSDPHADPLLAPPIYGRWHGGSRLVTPGGTSWLDQLNLDPRWRVAAAFGTHVIQEYQEALMASAWEQAAELQQVNQRMRQFQLSFAVGESLHERHFETPVVDDEMLLRVAAPVFGRIRQGVNGSTLLARQAASGLPVNATGSAMRRIGRQRGPLNRRIAAQSPERPESWVTNLRSRGRSITAAAGPVSEFCALPADLPSPEVLSQFSAFGLFTVSPEGATVSLPAPTMSADVKTEVPGFFRDAAIRHLTRFFPPRSLLIAAAPRDDMVNLKDLVLERTHPRVTLPALVRAVISISDRALAPTASNVTPFGVEGLMVPPSFPQPMYEPLRDLSQELLLPGLERVGADTVLGLKTNRRFVEAFMVGLNHEMGRELLWRGYPTDQRATYFEHFWGAGAASSAPPDITALDSWGNRALGDSETAPAGEEFVMLLRSSLLRRYPNAVIALVPAVRSGTAAGALAPSPEFDRELPPLFSGSMQPDVGFFGFPVTSKQATGADGGAGYYVVIQEHPTEPRFGLDGAGPADGASHFSANRPPPPGLPPDAEGWGSDAAHMAVITRRRPVRIAIHAARLIAPA